MGDRALTLYEIEQEYADLLDLETVVPPEFEHEFLERLADALSSRDHKRERVAQFFLFLDEQRAAIKAQKQRLQRRDDMFARAEERMYDYVGRVIKFLGKDAKGAYRKLQAPSATMYLRALPDSLEIADDTQIPATYKTASIEMPADLWQRLTDAHPELRMEQTLNVRVKTTVNREDVKLALKRGVEIPGADLRMSGWDHTLVVK